MCYFCQLDGVRRDISKIIGLPEIKRELEAIVEKIDYAEKQEATYGLRIDFPKPFHMAFVGNCGTGFLTSNLKLFYIYVLVLKK